MSEIAPVVIGGNGHSGTRIFNTIVTLGGVRTGITHLTRRANSDDLRILGLMDKWVGPYLYGKLGESGLRTMRRAYRRRLRLYFPFRSRRWGFKEPRTLLILPFLDELFPSMRFVHVIRDGRDIALGNPFVFGNHYIDAFLSEGEKGLPPEEKMILFWGRGNLKSMEYGTRVMGDRYLLMKWEDLCGQPREKGLELLEFSECKRDAIESVMPLIKRPSSMGRWKTYPEEVRGRVESRGLHWLKLFGYA